jgi:imidazoleglycerol phosphate dehydratase HisB
MIESLFKSFAYAVKQATRVNDNGQIISTKGML